MNYRKVTQTAAPSPAFIFGMNAPQKKISWRDLTDEDVAEIMFHPKVQAALKEGVDAMHEKMKKELCEGAAKALNERLEKEEEITSVVNILSIVKAMEAEQEARCEKDYSFRYQKKNEDGSFEYEEGIPKGFRKKFFSVPEIVEIIMTRQGDACREVGKDIKAAYEDFEKKYNEPMEFDSYRLNRELGLVDYDFVEDDSPFQYMTGWEIAEEMFRITNNADRYLITTSLLAELSSMPQFKKNSRLLTMVMERAMSRLRGLRTMDDIERQDKELRVRGVGLPISWKSDLIKFFKYQALSPSAAAFRDEEIEHDGQEEEDR